jgi:CheY-like chemotaxis protein
VADQLAAIDAWSRWQSGERVRLDAVAASRDGRVESSRRLDALDHERRAVDDRTRHDMYDDLRWRGSDQPRVVLAHRQPWFVQKVSACLAASGATVLECVEDGAEAMAAVVVHQPDLLVVSDLLPRVPAAEVVRRTRALAPATLVAVQVSDGGRSAEFVDGGASVVVGRRVPPEDVVEHALSRLDGAEAPLVLT